MNNNYDYLINQLKNDTIDELCNLDISNDILYLCNLFIIFCNSKGYDYKDTLINLLKLNVTVEEFITFNDEFFNWLKAYNNLKLITQEKLLKKGVNLNDESVIELYKGAYDTIVSKDCKIISPYASTLGEKNSIICKSEDSLYKVTEDGDITELPENKLYIINNYYSVKELLYLINVLAGTKNELCVAQSGLKVCSARKGNLKLFNQVLQLIENQKGVILDAEIDEENNIYTDSVHFDTSKMKEFIQSETLLPEKYLSYIYKGKGYNYDFKPRCK